MKKLHFTFAMFGVLILVLLLSCSSSGNKMLGLWKVSDVKTQFDETKVNPQTLLQVVELEKQTMLKFVDDTTLNIIMGEKTFKSHWNLDETSGKLTYSFEDSPLSTYDLGVYKDGSIVAESTTAVGTIVVTYQKTK